MLKPDTMPHKQTVLMAIFLTICTYANLAINAIIAYSYLSEHMLGNVYFEVSGAGMHYFGNALLPHSTYALEKDNGYYPKLKLHLTYFPLDPANKLHNH